MLFILVIPNEGWYVVRAHTWATHLTACFISGSESSDFFSAQVSSGHVYSQCLYRFVWLVLSKSTFSVSNVLVFINTSSFIKPAMEFCLHKYFFLLVQHKSLIKTTLRKLGAGLQLGQTQLEAFEVWLQDSSNYCQQQFICSMVCHWLVSAMKKHVKNETTLSMFPGYQCNTGISWWLNR